MEAKGLQRPVVDGEGRVLTHEVAKGYDAGSGFRKMDQISELLNHRMSDLGSRKLFSLCIAHSGRFGTCQIWRSMDLRRYLLYLYEMKDGRRGHLKALKLYKDMVPDSLLVHAIFVIVMVIQMAIHMVLITIISVSVILFRVEKPSSRKLAARLPTSKPFETTFEVFGNDKVNLNPKLTKSHKILLNPKTQNFQIS